jgi:hypothetical protein
VKDGVAGHSTELGAGNAEITGAVLSVTLIVCERVEKFPQSSVAVQVLVTEYSAAQLPFVLTSSKVGITLASQASVAVGVAKFGVAGHSMELGPGKELSTGAVLSVTVIVCERVEKFPQSSVAVQVLVTEYSAAQLPLVLISSNVGITLASHASVAVGVAKDGAAGHSIELGAGSDERTGAVLSSTVIVRDTVAVLPQALCAVQVLVILYS